MEVLPQQSAHYNHLQLEVVSTPDSRQIVHTARLSDTALLSYVSCPHVSLLADHRHHDDVLWTVNETGRAICVSDVCADALYLCLCVSWMNPSVHKNPELLL